MTEKDKGHDVGWNAAVAGVLRGERAARRMTLQEVADASGIPFVSVQRYFAMTRAIDVEILPALAAAVGMTPAQVWIAAEQRLKTTDPDLVETILNGIAEATEAAHPNGGDSQEDPDEPVTGSESGS